MTEQNEVPVYMRLNAIDAKVDLIGQTVLELKSALQKLTARYQWEEKTTETGIQIAGGPTTIAKTGILRGVCVLPTPQGLGFAFVLQDEASNRFAILSPDLVKPAT
jgi:hypothetical protein